MSEPPPENDLDSLLGNLTRPRVRGKDQMPRTRRAKPRPTLSVLSHPCAYLSRGRPIIRWTRDRQAQAISDGWFFERDHATNHVRLRCLPNGELRDASQAWAHITKQCFRNSPFHGLAIAFAEQQALHQFTDAWDKSCSAYHPRLRWFKDLAARQRTLSRASRGHR